MQYVTYIEVDVPTFTPTSPEQVETFRFVKPADYVPANIDAIPSISSISYTPSVISLGETMGQRAVLSVGFTDHKHIFAADSFESGSFWGKWRGRYGLKLRGRALRWYQGVVGQSLAEMEVRHFVIESNSGPDLAGRYTITAKDILKFADGDRAQAPVLSQGFIGGALDAVDTTFSLSPAGIGNAEYPASGYLCIGGDEIVSFTRSGDALTVVRGQFNTAAAAHDAGSRVQLCLHYDAQDPADILADLFENYAAVDPAYIPLDDWLVETGAYLQRLYTALIPEPTDVRKLVNEIIEQSALAMWWEPLTQEIKLQVLRGIPTSAQTFTPENTLKGSFGVAEQPNSRVSQVWIYFGQRDPTRTLDEIDNFRSTAIVADLEAEDTYGGAAIKKIFSRWIPFGALSVAQRVGQIQLARFKDPPRKFGFEVFRDYQGNELPPSLGGGYLLSAWPLQDVTGASVPAPVQVTKLDPQPDRYRVEAEEILFATIDPGDLTNRVITINSDINDVNLRTLHDDIYPVITGSESPEITVTCVVTSGAIVGSSNGSTPAFDVGSWPVMGIPITVQVAGRIQGAGGDGGGDSSGGPGEMGGTALYTRYAINLDDASGLLWGGGGGGGRARGVVSFPATDSRRGGGGGAGRIPGDGGAVSGGTSNINGNPGALDTGGGGGSGGGGTGGTGGTPGNAGGSGNGNQGSAGGAAGRSIDGISFVTTTSGPGDRRGPQVN